MEAASAAICIVPDQGHPDLAFVWSHLPSVLAGIAAPPESRGAVVINTERLNPAPPSTAGWTAQELVIRTALHHSDSVILVSDSDSENNSPMPAASSSLPALAPRHPGSNRRWMAELLSQLSLQKHLPGGGDECENEAILAGLLQINDYLDESHNHSQSIQGQGIDVNGDYWHGIMHRREPDYGNAKYWFRRIGHHPCYDQLPALAEQALAECTSPEADQWKSRLIGTNEWDAAAFVDLCESAEQSADANLTTAACRIQYAEMLLLLEHSYRQASGLQDTPA